MMPVAGTRMTFAAFLVTILLSACSSPIIQPPGGENVEAVLNDDHFIAHDGARLPVRAWRPATGEPAAIVIAVHGFNDYSNFFDDPGNFLAGHDITTYAFDQRGFGASPAPGLWPGIDALITDLETAAALIRTRHPQTPLYLLGESMGGAVVMVMLNKRPELAKQLNIDGVILSAPAVWGRVAMPWYQRLALWVSSHTFPGAKLTGQGLKIMASDNIEMLRALGRDPLIIKKTRVDAVYGLTNLMDAALEAAPGLDLPTLILYGDKDEIIPREPTEMMLSRLPDATGADRKVIFYEDGYHMLMRDLQAEIVWRDIAAWIGRRSGAADAR